VRRSKPFKGEVVGKHFGLIDRDVIIKSIAVIFMKKGGGFWSRSESRSQHNQWIPGKHLYIPGHNPRKASYLQGLWP
jgi:hypothetical protein